MVAFVVGHARWGLCGSFVLIRIRREGKIAIRLVERATRNGGVRWRRLCWRLGGGELSRDQRLQVGDMQRDGRGEVCEDVVAGWR